MLCSVIYRAHLGGRGSGAGVREPLFPLFLYLYFSKANWPTVFRVIYFTWFHWWWALSQFLRPPVSQFSGSILPDKENNEKIRTGKEWRDKTK